MISEENQLLFAKVTINSNDLIISTEKAVENMQEQYGEDWLCPKELFMHPLFMFEKFNFAGKYKEDVKLKQQFFEAVMVMKAQNQLHGYLMFDFDFSGIESDDPSEIQTAYVSKDVIKVIELEMEDADETVADIEEKLKDRIETINYLIDEKIPVEGVIVFPCKSRPSSAVTSSYATVYENELTELENVLTTLHQSRQRPSEVTSEVKFAMANLLYYTISKRQYPESEEEAIEEMNLWLLDQSDDEDISE